MWSFQKTGPAGSPGAGACRALAAIALLLLVTPLPVSAQSVDYPSRKLTFVVGFAPGGGIDTMARIVAQGLGDRFGYQIVVENRPGAASNIAARAVASAPPDGYTFLFTGNSLAINQTFYKNLTYSIDELRAVAMAAIDSHALAINASRPSRTLKEFLVASHRESFTFGYGGSSAHIIAEYVLKVLAKARPSGCPSKAVRRPSRHCWGTMSTSSPARSPRSIRRRSRARCARSP